MSDDGRGRVGPDLTPVVSSGAGRRAVAPMAVFGSTAGFVWVWAFFDQKRAVGDLAFVVWGILVIVLGIASGAVFVLGRRARDEVDAIQRVDWRPVKRTIGMSAGVAAALTSLNLVVDPSAGALRGVALTVLAIVGGSQAATTLLGTRAAVLSQGPLGNATNARRLLGHLRLRALGTRLLTALGSLVALTTFALGASMLATSPSQDVVSVAVLLVFGGFGSTLVGLVYAAPNVALRQEARALVDALAPLSAEEPSALRQELEARVELERRLGLHTGLLGELQAGIAVLGPLLGAAFAVLLRMQ